MQRPDFDVIVAGGGVGGAAAAYHLTEKGLRVLVVEKARLPRYKACGGAIPRPTLHRFPFALEGVIRAVPDLVRFSYPGMAAVDFPLDGSPVAMVMRSEFDACLLAHSGAEVLEGTAVTGVDEGAGGVQVQAGDRRLTARHLVGADGAASVVARRLGLRQGRQLCGALEAEVPLLGRPDLEDEYGHRAHFSLGVIPWCYAWVFPKGDGLSVGIGRFRPGHVDLRSALDGEMARLGISLDGVRLCGHPLPCYQAPAWPFGSRGAHERLATHRCLLVGDAAGLVDPLIGEGIRYAIVSARLAAEAIALGDLSGYESDVWREVGHSLATAGLVAGLFYRWPRRCFQLGVRNPLVIGQFLDVLTERGSYQGIGRRLLTVTALWLTRRRER